MFPTAATPLLRPALRPAAGPRPDRDRWICYEFMVKANTPGQRDGRLAFWIDGRLRGTSRTSGCATSPPSRPTSSASGCTR
jgi:hypothetical protein